MGIKEIIPFIAVIVALIVFVGNHWWDYHVRRLKEKRSKSNLQKGLVKEMEFWAESLEGFLPAETDYQLGETAQFCLEIKLSLFEANLNRIIILEDHIFQKVFGVYISVRIARRAAEVYFDAVSSSDTILRAAQSGVSATASRALDAMNSAVAAMQRREKHIMKLNTKQKIVLTIAAFVFVACILYPPWISTNHSTGVGTFSGYHWIFLRVEPPNYWATNIDYTQLIFQWVAVTVSCFVLMFLFKGDRRKHKEDEQTQSCSA